MQLASMKTVLFADGTVSRCVVELAPGVAMKGWPTAYVMHNGRMVWVKPGESVEFVEVKHVPWEKAKADQRAADKAETWRHGNPCNI